MELKTWKPAEGSRHSRKPVGRGPASGTGKSLAWSEWSEVCTGAYGQRLRRRSDSSGTSSS